MTEEVSPADERRGPDNRPELRASHGDRDQTVEILRDAAGDGQLTAAELDERLETALTARTRSELAELTADLRVVAERPAKELVKIDQRFGSGPTSAGLADTESIEASVISCLLSGQRSA